MMSFDLPEDVAALRDVVRDFAANEIRSVTVARMEVPCCGGLVRLVRAAMERARRDLPLNVVTIAATGEILQTHEPPSAHDAAAPVAKGA